MDLENAYIMARTDPTKTAGKWSMTHSGWLVNEAYTKLNALGTGSNTVENFYTYPADHAGTAQPITAEQRAAWAKQGVAQIEAGVSASDIKAIVQAL